MRWPIGRRCGSCRRRRRLIAVRPNATDRWYGRGARSLFRGYTYGKQATPGAWLLSASRGANGARPGASQIRLDRTPFAKPAVSIQRRAVRGRQGLRRGFSVSRDAVGPACAIRVFVRCGCGCVPYTCTARWLVPPPLLRRFGSGGRRGQSFARREGAHATAPLYSRFHAVRRTGRERTGSGGGKSRPLPIQWSHQDASGAAAAEAR